MQFAKHRPFGRWASTHPTAVRTSGECVGNGARQVLPMRLERSGRLATHGPRVRACIPSTHSPGQATTMLNTITKTSASNASNTMQTTSTRSVRLASMGVSDICYRRYLQATRPTCDPHQAAYPDGHSIITNDARLGGIFAKNDANPRLYLSRRQAHQCGPSED